MSLANYFAQFWPYDTGKRAVHGGYLALKAHPHLLADIALRNHVFAECPDQIAEGRRRAALEIIKLCNLDPNQLWGVIATKPKENRT
jgi:hypothetical protein